MDTGRIEDGLFQEISRRTDEMVDMRRFLHARPEVSFAETATSALVAEQLHEAGVTLRPCPTPTGAVGMLEGGRPGRTVLLRADIDALPIQERTGLPFASLVDGAMHACGHDAHTAAMLTVARVLGTVAEDLPGSYLFVFQPAEERVSGAEAMLGGGLLADVQPSAAIGMHVVTPAPVGHVLARPGLEMAGAVGLEIVVTGSGGHGAMTPRQGNVVLAASHIATRLHTVIDGMSHEETSYVCSPGMITAGTAPNVVPTRAEIAATLRWFEPELLEEAMQRLEALGADVGADFDVAVAIERAFETGPVQNDPVVTEIALAAARSCLPEVSVSVMPSPTAASDDMSVFLERVPGCYLLVGGGRHDGTSGMHHSPTFDIDEAALGIGATALAAGAVRLADPCTKLTQ